MRRHSKTQIGDHESTPVIDQKPARTIYVVAATKEEPAPGCSACMRSTSQPAPRKFGGPCRCFRQGSGTGSGSSAERGVPISLRENTERAGLLLNGGVPLHRVGPHGDRQSLHGWVPRHQFHDASATMMYDSKLPTVMDGGIWQAGWDWQPMRLRQSRFYVYPANGDFDVNTGGVGLRRLGSISSVPLEPWSITSLRYDQQNHGR